MASQLSIINAALVRLGATPLASLEDGTAQAVTAAALFSQVSDELLADFPWSFALREQDLSRVVLGPDDARLLGFQYAYQLPPECLRVLGLRCLSPFQLAGDQLYTSANAARLVYLRRVGVSAWSATFARLVTLELAAAFSMPITQSAQLAGIFYNEASAARPRARSLDSQQTPTHVFDLMRAYTRPSMNPLAGA